MRQLCILACLATWTGGCLDVPEFPADAIAPDGAAEIEVSGADVAADGSGGDSSTDTANPQDAASELPGAEVGPELPPDVPAELPPQDVPAELPQDVVPELPQDVPAELPQDVPAELPQDVVAELPQDISDVAPDEGTLPDLPADPGLDATPDGSDDAGPDTTGPDTIASDDIVATIKASRTVCASPCTVVFSAEETTAPGMDTSEIWRSLAYHWDFDTDETDLHGALYEQTYTYVAGDTAYEAGHVPLVTKTFLCDVGVCDYNVALRAQNADGEYDDVSITVSVSSESAMWSAANTVCVSNTLNPSDDWSGLDKPCPLGATKQNQMPDSDDFGDRLILVHRGDVFEQNIAPMMSESNFKIGTFGADGAPKPHFDGRLNFGTSSITMGPMHAPTQWWTFADSNDVETMGWPSNNTVEGIKVQAVSMPMSYQHIGLHDVDINQEGEPSGGEITIVRGNLYCYDFPNNTGKGLNCSLVPYPKGAYLSKVHVVGGDAAEAGMGTSLNVGAIGCGMSNYTGIVDSYFRKAHEHNLRVMGWYRFSIMRNVWAGEHYKSSKQKISTRVCGGGPEFLNWPTMAPDEYDDDPEGRTRADGYFGDGTMNFNTGSYAHVSRFQVTNGNQIGVAGVVGSHLGGPKYQTNIPKDSNYVALARDIIVTNNQFENDAGQSTVDINAPGHYFSCIGNDYSEGSNGGCFPSSLPGWEMSVEPTPVPTPNPPGS